MRKFMLMIAIFIQGCVLHLATYNVMQKIEGGFPSFYPNDVIAAYFDKSKKEFVLCVTDLTLSGKTGVSDRFTLKIPQEINEIEKDHRFDVIQMKLR
ncbi:MAG: hypothetical protein ACU84H_15415 [Gammaproteobacteria bacterium]